MVTRWACTASCQAIGPLASNHPEAWLYWRSTARDFDRNLSSFRLSLLCIERTLSGKEYTDSSHVAYGKWPGNLYDFAFYYLRRFGCYETYRSWQQILHLLSLRILLVPWHRPVRFTRSRQSPSSMPQLYAKLKSVRLSPSVGRADTLQSARNLCFIIKPVISPAANKVTVGGRKNADGGSFEL